MSDSEITPEQAPESSLKRSPGLAFGLGLLVPGLGQLYNDEGRKAVAVFLGSLFLSLLCLTSGGIWIKMGWRGLLAAYGVCWAYRIGTAIAAARAAKRRDLLSLSDYSRPPALTIIALCYWLLLPYGIKALAEPTMPYWPVRIFSIPSSSMEPTIRVGDHIALDHTAYYTTVPQRMDIIVHQTEDGRAPLVKRVAAVAGDTVEIKDGKLLVNGQPVTYPAKEPFFRNYGPSKVPADHVFTLGDNLNNSRDSRFTGPVPITAIEGKVRTIFWGPGAGTDFP